MGSDIRGQISILVVNIAIIQMLNEIYTGYALVHFVPKFNLRKLYANGLGWTFICISLLTFIFWVFQLSPAWQVLHLYLLTFIITLNSFHGVILLGRERFRAFNFVNLAQPLLLLSSLCILIFYSGMRSTQAYIFVMYGSYGISILISGLLVIRELRLKPENHLMEFKQVIQSGVFNQLGNLAHVLTNRINYYLLGTEALVGVYSSSTSIIESVWLVSSSASAIVLSYMANSKSEEKNKMAEVVLVLCKLSFALSLIGVMALMALPDAFYIFILGRDFSEAKSIMFHLAPGILSISFSMIISHYFSGLGQQKLLLKANSVGLVIAAATSWFFIGNFGLKGACYAASVSYFATALTLTLAFVIRNKVSPASFFGMGKAVSVLKSLK